MELDVDTNSPSSVNPNNESAHSYFIPLSSSLNNDTVAKELQVTLITVNFIS